MLETISHAEVIDGAPRSRLRAMDAGPSRRQTAACLEIGACERADALAKRAQRRARPQRPRALPAAWDIVRPGSTKGAASAGAAYLERAPLGRPFARSAVGSSHGRTAHDRRANAREGRPLASPLGADRAPASLPPCQGSP